MTDSVAYFSMEVGIKPEIKTYSGGLGVLAGDTLKSAADLGENFVAVTLLYRDGYFSQELNDGWQEERNQGWDYEELLEDTGETCEIEIHGRHVKFKIWKYTVEGEDGEVDVLFLDTGLEENIDEDRMLTARLYADGDRVRLGQETLLGIGGVRALEELGYSPDYYHMNEGHSALLTIEADGKKVFTTHTPVPAGHDEFEQDLVEDVLGIRSDNFDIGGKLNMTELALKHANYSNAVSDKHQEVSERMFPDYEFEGVTNGVHSISWTCDNFQKIYSKYIDNWRNDPQRLTRAFKIPDKELWNAKKEAKRELSELLNDKTGRELDADKLTVGFARRSTAYKRPELIFKDLDKLEKLGKKYDGFQLVFGGKAHPKDTQGKEIISRIIQYSGMLEHVDVHFIPDYGMHDALRMVAGCDLWLNNPVRGQEASGTSGMKAAHNATPQLSTLDGWWIEGHIEDITGWAVGEDYVEEEEEDVVDSESIYRKLDHILSIYHNDRKKWIEIMKNCIAVNASYFNTHRMVKEYMAEAYK